MAGEWKKLTTTHSSFKRSGVLPVAAVALLCAASYLLALWQHSSGSTSTSTSTLFSLSCNPSPSSSSSSRSSSLRTLDFTAHHTADDTALTSPETKKFPACDPKYSEYTPCEDRDRSLKFDRDRLIYRERHCPAKNEIFKCLIPAPAGYRNPFPWPASRGTAWFANVPHKELSVEKAVQNWIRVDGDKFRFPGGGTMFPRGADAYIDDIAKLVPLSDGTIRTVVDTGCGVSEL